MIVLQDASTLMGGMNAAVMMDMKEMEGHVQVQLLLNYSLPFNDRLCK